MSKVLTAAENARHTHAALQGYTEDCGYFLARTLCGVSNVETVKIGPDRWHEVTCPNCREEVGSIPKAFAL